MSRAEVMPGATLMLLPEAGKPDGHRKTQLIFHSTGTRAGARANRKYFGLVRIKEESTFVVDYDGEILQVMWASDKADANMRASVRAISVETVGTGDEPWTPAQYASCRRIARWCHDEHDIPYVQIPSEPASGIGWHVMFGAPGPWTKVRGKVCPGAKRIVQVRQLTRELGQAKSSTDGTKPTTDTEDHMSPAQEARLLAKLDGLISEVQAVRTQDLGAPASNDGRTPGTIRDVIFDQTTRAIEHFGGKR